VPLKPVCDIPAIPSDEGDKSRRSLENDALGLPTRHRQGCGVRHRIEARRSAAAITREIPSAAAIPTGSLAILTSIISLDYQRENLERSTRIV
jgi:hypothetical protein